MSSKNTPFLYLHFLVILFSFNASKLYSQNNASTSLYDWYDSKVGKENLDINKGRILLNYDRVLNNNDRFYFSEYKLGSVVYDNQIYNSVLLNYDILNDNLILKPNGEFDKNPVTLIKEKLQYFYIDEKKYVNINYSENKLPEFMRGFFEEKTIGTNFIFLIKHNKNKSSVIKNDQLIDDFTETTSYFIKYKNNYYEVKSKKNILLFLPEYKKSINEFYSNNQLVEKSNKTKFFEDLFNFLDTLIK